MKFDFRYVFVKTLNRNHKKFKQFCSYSSWNIFPAYPGILGLIGVLLSLCDIVKIIKNGSILPHSLWRSRIKSGRLVTPECERDLKLICLVLSLEYYFLLICGTAFRNPLLFIPWLLLYAFIITLEFVIFCLKIFTEGIIFKKHALIMSMFVIYNWLVIFCSLFRLMGNCR